MQIMGIDIGSTSIKTGLFTPEGKLLSLGRTETPLDTYSLPEGGELLTLPPDKLWTGVTASIRNCLKNAGGNRDVGGVAVTGFGSDAVALDPEGNPVFPIISFYDKATIEQRDDYLELIEDLRSYEITGIRPWYYLTLFRIMWLKKYFPELYEKAEVWLNATDYINYMLSGVKATDYSEASTTLAFDQKKLAWSDTILDKVGIEKRVFPKALPSGTLLGGVTGEAAEQTGLKEGTAVVLGGHDNVTSYFAAASRESEVVTVTGTFESIMISQDSPVILKEGMESNLVCEKGVVQDKYVLIGVQYAGGIIEWIRKTLFTAECKDNASLFSHIEHTSPGAGGLMFLPHIFGSITPVQDVFSRGCFAGISDRAKKADFLRAAVEGINYQTRLMYETLTSVSGIAPMEILNIGGAVYSDFWMQNRADILDVSIKVLDIPEVTALGAAMLAGIGSGLYNSFEDARSAVRYEYREIAPKRKNAELYQAWYERAYKNFYPAVRDINHFLAQNAWGKADG